MTAARRLLAVAAAASAFAAFAVAGPRVVSACDQYSCTPVVAAVSPYQITLDGKPLHLTITGYGFTGVTQVLLAPVASLQGFTVFNDSTILVTLPAGATPGIYSVRVISPLGGSDPAVAPQFQVFPAAPPSQAPTPTPRPTPTPVPTPTPSPPVPETGVVALAPASAHGSGGGGTTGVGSGAAPIGVTEVGAPQASTVSAPVDIMFGLALGAILYLLWGSPRRLSGSWRSAPWLHLFGRPVQALHAGRICLYCGRLHFLWSTRRDLWREGRYCGPKCFISAEAMPSPLVEEDEPEPVMQQKTAAWWHAAVAIDHGLVDFDSGPRSDHRGWRPRF